MARTNRRKTKLKRLLEERDIRPVDVERKLRERIGEEHRPDQRQISRWCSGETEPRRKWLVRILWAVRELAGDPAIRIEDVFDLDPDNPANWMD